MDPLTAIGLSANIMQFFDFVAKLVSATREVHETARGATLDNADLEIVTESLIQLNDRVARSVGSSTRPSQDTLGAPYDLDLLASACNEVATELLETLKKVRAGNKPGKWKGLVAAFKSMWAQGQIEALRRRVDQYRSTMQSALLISLGHKVDCISNDMLDKLASGSALDRLRIDLLQEIRRFGSGQHGSSQAKLLKSLSTMTEQERNLHFQSLMFDHLSLSNQSDREHRIATAHQETFHWIFSNRNREGYQEKDWSDFVSWLRSDDDPLYWITGKAGSGKSTLMKYVVHEQRCKDFLVDWADDIPVIMTRFYFWNSGDQDQRSQEGLLRSILHDALTQRPVELAKTFPSRWSRWNLLGFDDSPWTRAELVQGFENLLASADGTFKICMFVDGLDEFDNDLTELITLFQGAIAYPNVKVCVASRPWIVFEEAFAHRPSLMLQNLTYPDILCYIRATFDGSKGFTASQKREPEFAANLITNIAEKSCGVFLWVTLVIKLLVSGLANFDRISDLQRRLDQMPADLGDFYQKIFDSIDPFYASHAAQMFTLVAAADGRLTALGLSFADSDDENLALLRDVSPLSSEEEEYRFEEARRRLNSRCKGFLEIPSIVYAKEQTANEVEESWRVVRLNSVERREHSLPGPTLDLVALPFRRVTYLHRTVRYFIESPPIKTRIAEMIGDFNPYISLLRSSLLMIKTWDDMSGHQNSLAVHLKQAMNYAMKIEAGGSSTPGLVDEIDPSVRRIFSRSSSPMNFPATSPVELYRRAAYFNTTTKYLINSYWDFVAQYNLPSYIYSKVCQGIDFFPNQEHRPLLDHIIVRYPSFLSFREPSLAATSSHPPSLALVAYLLARGDDPNYESEGRTTWSCLLDDVIFGVYNTTKILRILG